MRIFTFPALLSLAMTTLMGIAPLNAAVVSEKQSSDPFRIAKAEDLPGKFQVGQCKPFAEELLSRMEGANCTAFLVIYHWESLQMDPRFKGGTHAMVVFRSQNGNHYGMDNLRWRPVRLRGETPAEWASSFVGMNSVASVRRALGTSAGNTRLIAKAQPIEQPGMPLESLPLASVSSPVQ